MKIHQYYQNIFYFKRFVWVVLAGLMSLEAYHFPTLHTPSFFSKPLCTKKTALYGAGLCTAGLGAFAAVKYNALPSIGLPRFFNVANVWNFAQKNGHILGGGAIFAGMNMNIRSWFSWFKRPMMHVPGVFFNPAGQVVKPVSCVVAPVACDSNMDESVMRIAALTAQYQQLVSQNKNLLKQVEELDTEIREIDGAFEGTDSLENELNIHVENRKDAQPRTMCPKKNAGDIEEECLVLSELNKNLAAAIAQRKDSINQLYIALSTIPDSPRTPAHVVTQPAQVQLGSPTPKIKERSVLRADRKQKLRAGSQGSPLRVKSYRKENNENAAENEEGDDGKVTSSLRLNLNFSRIANGLSPLPEKGALTGSGVTAVPHSPSTPPRHLKTILALRQAGQQAPIKEGQMDTTFCPQDQAVSPVPICPPTPESPLRTPDSAARHAGHGFNKTGHALRLAELEN